MNSTTNKSCSSCGVLFLCQVQNSCGTCWCYDFPVVFLSDIKKDCMCPFCLESTLQLQKNDVPEKLTTDILINKKNEA